jgi:hypothetical protein
MFASRGVEASRREQLIAPCHKQQTTINSCGFVFFHHSSRTLLIFSRSAARRISHNYSAVFFAVDTRKLQLKGARIYCQLPTSISQCIIATAGNSRFLSRSPNEILSLAVCLNCLLFGTSVSPENSSVTQEHSRSTHKLY